MTKYYRNMVQDIIDKRYDGQKTLSVSEVREVLRIFVEEVAGNNLNEAARLLGIKSAGHLQRNMTGLSGNVKLRFVAPQILEALGMEKDPVYVRKAR